MVLETSDTQLVLIHRTIFSFSFLSFLITLYYFFSNIDDYDKEDDNGEDFITFVKNSRKKAATKNSTTATPKAKIPKTAGASTSKAKTSSTKALKTNNENNKSKRCMPKTVDKKLEEMGYNAASVSFCLKAGICKGFYKLTEPSDLEAVIIEGEHDCHTFKVKLKDLIYQPDSGDDYEDGSEAATTLCNCCKEDEDDYWPGKAYVTGLCTGKPDFDCGKFHNHCRECKKGFGVCLRDYRMAHCDRCNKHWFTGLTGFPCDNCKRIKQQARGIAGLFMRDSDDDSQSSDDSYGGPTNGCSIS